MSTDTSTPSTAADTTTGTEVLTVPDVEPETVSPTAGMSIKDKQAAYHDWEAETYEDKFSISYDQRCIDYAVDRFRKVVDADTTFERVLELGAGTGFFCINLHLGGCLEGAEVHVNDISEGMLEVCTRNAAEHGLEVHGLVGDAENLPYEDDTFDLVIGHAFIHHLPDVQRCIDEIHRVLKPGGRVVIAGEPTEWGDRFAGWVKKASYRTVKAVTSLPGLDRMRRPSVAETHGTEEAFLAALEHEVDLHVFPPDEVRGMALRAGFADADVVTEELTANWVGWVGRTVEGMLRTDALGARWAYGMFNTYRSLFWLDEQVLSHVVPQQFFYNLILHATKADAPDAASAVEA